MRSSAQFLIAGFMVCLAVLFVPPEMEQLGIQSAIAYPLRILIVPSDLPDLASLTALARPGIVVVPYKSGTMTLNRLAARIATSAGGVPIDSLGIVVHARRPGSIDLLAAAPTTVDAIRHDPDQRYFWRHIGSLMSQRGSIDLLSCNLASHPLGKRLILELESLTGTQVFASADVTGNALQGGDWFLEHGDIDARGRYFLPDRLDAFAGTLASVVKRLVPSDFGNYENPGWEIGEGVAVDQDIAAVGASARYIKGGYPFSGGVYVYERNKGGTNAWGESAFVDNPTASGTAAYTASYDSFGNSVSLSGDYLVVGAEGEDPWGTGDRRWVGAAYLFERNRGGANTWGLVKKFKAPDAAWYDKFGNETEIRDDIIAIGAPYKNESRGSIYIYGMNAGGQGAWGLLKKIVAPDTSTVNGYGILFGKSISLSGEYLAVSAPWKYSGYDFQGAVYILGRNAGGKNQFGIVKKLIPEYSINFGWSLSLSGSTLAVGAWPEPSFTHTQIGAVYLFEKDEGGKNNWGLRKKIQFDSANYLGLGQSVALDGDFLLAGAPGWGRDLPGRVEEEGALYLMHRNQGGDDTWGLVEILKAPDPSPVSWLGYNAAFRDGVAIGAAWKKNMWQGGAYLYEGFGPDLFVKTVSRPSSLTWIQGESRSLKIRVACKGTVSSVKAPLIAYLCPKASFDRDSATEIATALVPTMKPGQSKLVKMTLPVPADLQAGKYYLFISLDPDITIPDAKRSNNLFKFKSAIQIEEE